ncbi:MAG: GtrA family protein [Dehalococcoidia bacterium]
MIRALHAALDREVVRYGIVGASGVVVDLLLLSLLHEVAGVPLLIANVVSFSAAVASNYRLNSWWTFRTREQRSHMVGGALFVFAAVIGLGISEAGLWLITERLGIHYVWTKLGLVGVVFAWNFLFNSAVTFRHQGAPATTRR